MSRGLSLPPPQRRCDIYIYIHTHARTHMLASTTHCQASNAQQHTSTTRQQKLRQLLRKSYQHRICTKLNKTDKQVPKHTNKRRSKQLEYAKAGVDRLVEKCFFFCTCTSKKLEYTKAGINHLIEKCLFWGTSTIQSTMLNPSSEASSICMQSSSKLRASLLLFILFCVSA